MRTTSTRLFALSLGSLGIALLVVEFIARCFYVLPTPMARRYPLGLGVADSRMEVRHREFQITLAYDLVGFRESGIGDHAPADAKRILFLGDSFAEGYGVEAHERFSNRLIESLNTGGRGRFHGIHAGQLYADPDSYLNNLADFGIALQPDIVVMALFMGNDFMDARQYQTDSAPVVREHFDGDPHYGISSPAAILSLRYTRALVQQSWSGQQQLFRRVNGGEVRMAELFFQKPIDRRWYLDFMAPIGIDEKTFDAITATVDPETLADLFSGIQSPSVLIDRVIHSHIGDERAGWTYNDDDFAKVLAVVRTADQICRQRSIRFVVVVLPFIGEVEPASFDGFLRKVGYSEAPKRATQVPGLHQSLLAALTSDGIAVCDPTDALRAAQGPTYFPMDQHLTPRGHAIVAAELRATLRDLAIDAGAAAGEEERR